MITVCFLSSCENGAGTPPLLLSPNNKGVWKNIKGTPVLDPDFLNADYFVIRETTKKEVLTLIPKEKTICFPSEPDDIRVRKVYHGKGFKYVFNYYNNIHPFDALYFMGNDYDFYKNLKYPEKNKTCSCVMSGKVMTKMHKKRKNFLINFVNKYPNVIDHWGESWKYPHPTYKGTLSKGNKHGHPTKLDALLPYKYTIVCENNTDNFTEKLTDAFMCHTIPIFAGKKNLSDYFPKESFYQIDLDNPNVNDEIVNIIEKPITDENIKALKIARQLCLEHYNIWELVHHVIEYDKSKSSEPYQHFRYIDNKELFEKL